MQFVVVAGIVHEFLSFQITSWPYAALPVSKSQKYVYPKLEALNPKPLGGFLCQAMCL